MVVGEYQISKEMQGHSDPAFCEWLSADLPWVRHEPFAADPTRPLSGSPSLHRALSYKRWDGWHDIIADYLLGGSENLSFGRFRNGGVGGSVSAGRWVRF